MKILYKLKEWFGRKPKPRKSLGMKPPLTCQKERDVMVCLHQYGRCCGCNKSMQESQLLNLLITLRKAEWNYPVGFKPLIFGKIALAIAILCDDCYQKGKCKGFETNLVVEYDSNEKIPIVYHPVANLEKVSQEDIVCSRN